MSVVVKVLASITKYKHVRRELAWVTIGNAAAVVGGLVTVRVLTEFLHPAAYGQLALAITLATLVNQTVMGPLSNGATRFYSPARQCKDIASYIAAVRNLALWATAIIILVASLLTLAFLLTNQSGWIGLVVATLVFAGFSGYSSILNGIQSASRQRSIVALHQGSEPWIRVALAAAFMLWLGSNSEAVMIGYAAGIFLVLGSQYFFFSQTKIPIFIVGSGAERTIRKDIWRFSWPIAAFGTFTWVQLVSDRWALQLFGTSEDVGLYAVLVQLGYYPILLASGVVGQLIGPIFYQWAGDASDAKGHVKVSNVSRQLTIMTLVATSICFMAAFLLHAELFAIFVADEYTVVSHFLPWMVLSGGLFAAGQIVSLDLMSKMKTRFMMTAKIGTAVFGTMLNIAGAYSYRTAGVVAASLVFSLSYFGWMVMLSRDLSGSLCGRLQ